MARNGTCGVRGHHLAVRDPMQLYKYMNMKCYRKYYVIESDIMNIYIYIDIIKYMNVIESIV